MRRKAETYEDRLSRHVSACSYKLGVTLGGGAEALVKQVSSRNKNIIGALKVLAYNYEFGLRSPLEVDIPSRISHPNIIRKLDILSHTKCKFNGVGIITVIGQARADSRSLYVNYY